jgi:L-seryl-tRNA(Ser) seleniumtransferase
LFGGPQAGVIVGRAELIERCGKHPLARAMRPGGLVLAALQQLALAYLARDVVDVAPFWRMATTSLEELTRRADVVAATTGAQRVTTESVPGAGSAPGTTILSVGLAVDGDRLCELRAHDPPVIARTVDERTVLDLRTVDPADDEVVIAALRSLN